MKINIWVFREQNLPPQNLSLWQAELKTIQAQNTQEEFVTSPQWPEGIWVEGLFLSRAVTRDLCKNYGLDSKTRVHSVTHCPWWLRKSTRLLNMCFPICMWELPSSPLKSQSGLPCPATSSFIFNWRWCLRKGLQEPRWWLSKDSTCQCRRLRFNPWSRRIPHSGEQLCLCATTIEPVLWSLRVTAAEPLYCNCWSSRALKPILCNKISHCNEKPVYNWKVVPTSCN